MRRISFLCGALLGLALALPAPRTEGQGFDDYFRRFFEPPAGGAEDQASKNLERAYELISRARDLKEKGNLREAVPLMEEAVRLVPDSAASGRIAVVLSSRKRVYVTWKNKDRLRADLGEMYGLLGEKAKAGAEFRRALESLQAKLKSLPGEGSLNDWKALSQWKEVQLDFSYVYSMMGEENRSREIDSTVVRVFQAAAERNGANHRLRVSIYSDLADTFDERKEAERAKASRRKVVESLRATLGALGPDQHEEREGAYLELGKTYEELGDFAQARASYRQAMARRPGGRPSQMEDSARRALLNLEAEQAKAAAAGSGPAEAHFRQGFELLKAGKADEAAVEFQAGLSKKPGEPMAHFYVAEAYGRRGDAPSAFEHYLASLDAGVKEPHASQARRAAAILVLRQGIASIGVEFDVSPIARLAREGLFHARTGSPAEARALFAQALEKTARIKERNCFTAFPCKSQALAEIATRQAAADPDGAMKTAQQIPDPTARAYALARIARALAKQGATGPARGVIAQAFEQVTAEASTFRRVLGLRHIVEALWEMGDADGARKALRVMHTAAEANTRVAQAPDEWLKRYFESFGKESVAALDRRGHALIQLTLVLLKTGDREGARQAAGQIQNEFSRAELVREVADAGYPEEAEEFSPGLSERNDIAEDRAFSALAESYARQGRFEAAWRVAGRIRGDKYAREKAYDTIASVQAEAGDTEGARTALTQAGRRVFMHDLRRAHALGLARKGDYRAALKAEPEVHHHFDYNFALAYSIMGMKEE